MSEIYRYTYMGQAMDKIAQMLNMCIEKGCVPSQWEKYRTFIIPKKQSAVTPDKCRDIAVMTILSKIYFGIMEKHIQLKLPYVLHTTTISTTINPQGLEQGKDLFQGKDWYDKKGSWGLVYCVTVQCGNLNNKGLNHWYCHMVNGVTLQKHYSTSTGKYKGGSRLNC